MSQSSNRRMAARRDTAPSSAARRGAVRRGAGRTRQLSLHAMCSSNAVLARDSTGPVFGNGTPGDAVTVKLSRGSTVIKKVRCLPFSSVLEVRAILEHISYIV